MSEGAESAGVSGVSQCYIMDEVDGLCGNSDRGGTKGIIGMIKNTKSPVICICNDSFKIKSLKTHCLEMAWTKPNPAQILARLSYICSEEKVNLSKSDLEKIIINAKQDVRQAINFAQMYSSGPMLPLDLVSGQKDFELNAFEAAEIIFRRPKVFLLLLFFDDFYFKYILVRFLVLVLIFCTHICTHICIYSCSIYPPLLLHSCPHPLLLTFDLDFHSTFAPRFLSRFCSTLFIPLLLALLFHFHIIFV